MARISAVLEGREFRPLQKDAPKEVLDTQRKLYESQAALYRSSLSEREKALSEAETALKTLREEARKLEELLAITADTEKRQKALVELGAVAENRHREKLRERISLEKDLEAKRGQAEEAGTRVERVRHEMDSFKSSFREKMLSELATNLQGKNALEAEVNGLHFRKDRRSITAPVDGYVHVLSVKTVGGVVTPAQQVVSLVPENAPLQAQVLVFNKDIGFVRPGQRCAVKVDTFDFQKYGVVEGEVATVNPFSVEDKENAGDAYPVHVSLSSEELTTRDGERHFVRPGMTVNAEINVGKRRVIEFFLFPIIKYLDEGLKVR